MSIWGSGIFGSSGGGSNPVAVQKDGITVDPDVKFINFSGINVDVIQTSAGNVDVVVKDSSKTIEFSGTGTFPGSVVVTTYPVTDKAIKLAIVSVDTTTSNVQVSELVITNNGTTPVVAENIISGTTLPITFSVGLNGSGTNVELVMASSATATIDYYGFELSVV